MPTSRNLKVFRRRFGIYCSFNRLPETEVSCSSWEFIDQLEKDHPAPSSRWFDVDNPAFSRPAIPEVIAGLAIQDTSGTGMV